MTNEQTQGEDVTSRLLSDLRVGPLPIEWRTRFRSLEAIKTPTDAGLRVMSAFDGLLVEYVSNPLMYSMQIRSRANTRDMLTLWRLLLGGHLRVMRLRGPLSDDLAINRPARVGFNAECHYRIEKNTTEKKS